MFQILVELFYISMSVYNFYQQFKNILWIINMYYIY